jgi:type III pantothenate kinase
MSATDTASILVDIGNTRIKWGYCPRGTGAAIEEAASLLPNDKHGWEYQRAAWLGSGTCDWIISGVHPECVDSFKQWVRAHNEQLQSIEDPKGLPLVVALAEPAKVGIDRLLNAVAANTLRPPDMPVVIADIGSAVTVDWVDENGVFKGGAIFPGLRLMAKALNEYTALLPLVEVWRNLPQLPGTSTREAIEAGLTWTVVGGVVSLTDQMIARRGGRQALRLLTGGDSELLHGALAECGPGWRHVPILTLEGLRLAAGARS